LRPTMAERNQTSLFFDIEMPLVSVLADMEWEGVAIDQALLAGLSEEYTKRLMNISADIYRLAGEEFNLNSPKQISAILFDKLNLPKSKKTKTGLSTDVDALEKLQDSHPLVPRLLEYREVQKLLSTYIDALSPQVLKESGRLHHPHSTRTIARNGQVVEHQSQICRTYRFAPTRDGQSARPSLRARHIHRLGRLFAN